MSKLSDIIIAADDIESETVEVPQWGVTVVVKSMTAGDRAKLLSGAINNGGQLDFEEVLPDVVILCTYDPETGERVFGPQHREAVMGKSAAAVETVAMRLSGLNDDAVDAAGKGSSETPTEGSSLS